MRFFFFSGSHLKGVGCPEVYTNLFKTSGVWQVFKVGVPNVPYKLFCRKGLLTSKRDYQGQILVNYSCHGCTFVWVGECVLGKMPKGCFSWYLEFGCGSKVIPQWLFMFIIVKTMTTSFVISSECWKTTSWPVFSLEWQNAKMWMKDVSRFLR